MGKEVTAKKARPGVRKSQLKKLVNNYYQKMKIIDTDGSLIDLDPRKHSQSVWFSKAAIDKLFADHNCNGKNNEEFGLRVYFAVHETGVLHPDHEIKPEYHNQHTVVLVPTRKNAFEVQQDLLVDDLKEEVFGKGDGQHPDDEGLGGDGLNHGKLCPPDSDCPQVL